MDVARKLESYTIEDIYALPDGERAELIDGKIYYQESDDGYSIGSMTTAGEENHTIIEFENIVSLLN